MARPRKTSAPPKDAQSYRHPDADLAARPEIGAQAHFKKSKPPTTYRFDSSLAPSLEWDGQNPAREKGEFLLAAATDNARHLRTLLAQLREEAGRVPAVDRKPLLKLIDEVEQALAGNRNALDRLQKLSKPFLNWSGKAERLSFDVPTLPLFVHERLSTKAILETLKGHQRDKQDDFLNALYGFQERPLADQLLRAYEYRDNWVNRLMLGDSLVVMNSLLRYESLGGQVQMIYVDPPYGVKFGSNFQPFVRKRDVSHNDDADLTREPEMVQAYRDTWELGLHSYLTYLRDRLLLARELLAPSGSIFVQISDENLHHVREVMDEVFGAENFCSVIAFSKTGSLAAEGLANVCDYVLFYAKDKPAQKLRPLLISKEELGIAESYSWLELADGTRRPMSAEEKRNASAVPQGAKFFQPTSLISSGSTATGSFDYKFDGKTFRPPSNSHWKTTREGLDRLVEQNRVVATTNSLRYVRYLDDFPVAPITNMWTGLGLGSFTEEQVYVVQTAPRVIQRCLLMTTDPGDLVLDPTCGSGTTAFVAEQWGRRWITCDTSRVPLALARQRLLTATFDYYQINATNPLTPALSPSEGAREKTSSAGRPLRYSDSQGARVAVPPLPLGGGEGRGEGEAGALPNSPANGFVYKRRQNQKGEEVGGIVPHITLKSIANNEPPAEEVLVDRPEVLRSVVRVTGPFSFEATIPTAEGLDTEPETPGIQGEPHENYVQRMLEVLRRAPVLRLPGNQTVTLKNIRPPAKTLTLSAEAMVDSGRTLALTPALSPGEREKLSPSPEKSKRSDSTQTRGVIPPLPAGEGRGEGERSELNETPSSASQPVAILFGPENGPLSERLVREAWDEAGLKHYSRLYVIGFAIDPKARQFIDSAGQIGIPCTYLQATMDLQMGDLLKNMRSSQIFSVCGLPDVAVRPVKPAKPAKSAIRNPQSEMEQWQVELLGLDTFDPITMDADHLKAADVPAWFLDTDYNGMVFRVRQAFFPRTGAWENLKKSLRVEFEDTVWDHLAGTTSAPFPAGEHGQIAVKVIDPRGNELLVVKKLEESK